MSVKSLFTLNLILSLAGFGFGQTTEVQYLSGRGTDDAVDWEFFCTAGARSGQWTTSGIHLNKNKQSGGQQIR